MRVAIFTEVYWPMISGVSVTLQRLVEALVRRGHAARVYSATYPLPAGTTDRPEVHRSPSRPFIVSPEVQWAAPRRNDVLRDLAGFQPDLVHVATEFPMGFMGLGLARDLKLPILASAHTDYERYAGRYGFTWAVSPGWVYLRWFYGQAALVLAPSRTYEQHLNQRGISHTGVWSRGVDPLVFSPVHRSSAYRAELGIIPEDPLVTYIGRVAPEKGIESLLDAWATLGERRGRAQLAIVGGGLMEAEIRRRRLPAVHLMGRLTGTALSTAYASADVLVFPSATETFGNVLLEGMASGLACLAIGAGGVTTFARDGENAILLPPGDAPAMSAALGRLIADAELRARLGRSARDSALRLGWEPVFDRLFEDYRRVTGTAGRYRAA